MNDHRDGERQRGRTVSGRAQVQQEEQDDEARDDRLLGQSLLERVDRLVDDGRAVVEGDDPDLRDAAVGQRLAGQAGRELGDLLLDPLDHRARVLAVAHEHHAADGLDAGLVQRAAAEVRAELHRGHVA